MGSVVRGLFLRLLATASLLVSCSESCFEERHSGLKHAYCRNFYPESCFGERSKPAYCLNSYSGFVSLPVSEGLRRSVALNLNEDQHPSGHLHFGHDYVLLAFLTPCR